MKKLSGISWSMLLLIVTQVIVTPVVISKEEDSNLPITVLRPEIKSYVDNNVYNVDYRRLKPFLETVMVVENPDIAKKKLMSNQYKIEINPVKDLNVNSKSGRYVVGFDKKMTKMVGVGDNIFVSGLAADRYYHYALLRPRFSYYHPKTKEYLGTDLLIIGRAKVIKRGRISTLQISEARELVQAGTLVLPGRGLNINNDIKATTSDRKFVGSILSIIPDLRNAATNNVVVMNIGKRDGIAIGELLYVKQPDIIADDPYDKKASHKLPNLEPKGEIVVYDVFNKISLGIIVNGREAVGELDAVVNHL